MGIRNAAVGIVIAAATMTACGGTNDDAKFEPSATADGVESGTIPPDTVQSDTVAPDTVAPETRKLQSETSTLSPAEIADLELQLDDIDELLQVVETDLGED